MQETANIKCIVLEVYVLKKLCNSNSLYTDFTVQMLLVASPCLARALSASPE